jgi:hypothetical protein
MRCVILALAMCSAVVAGTIQATATCDGTLYTGTGSVICGDELLVGASAGVGQYFVYAGAINSTGHTAAASSQFSMDYVLTFVGGTGDAFAEPLLSAGGGTEGGMAGAAGGVTFGTSMGNGCEAGVAGNPFDTCNSTSLPFVFGVPIDVTLSMNAWANSGPDYAASVNGGASFSGFEVFVDGQPVAASYTLVPADAPEPGMAPVLALACLALAKVRRRLRL